MQSVNIEENDAEVVRRAQEEGRVNVIFPGMVTQDSCCRFVSEILKCVLYQRQQLPMTYDQLVYSQKKQQVTSKYTAYLDLFFFKSCESNIHLKMLCPGETCRKLETRAVCRLLLAKVSADPAGVRRGAAPVGSAFFTQQDSPGAIVAGWFNHSAQRNVRDQHGGSGSGQLGSMSTRVLLLTPTIPQPVCG